MIVLDKDLFRQNIREHIDEYGFVDISMTSLMHMLENSEVDVEKVVRCRDCIHRDKSVCAEVKKTVKANEFCAWGKKRK